MKYRLGPRVGPVCWKPPMHTGRAWRRELGHHPALRLLVPEHACHAKLAGREFTGVEFWTSGPGGSASTAGVRGFLTGARLVTQNFHNARV